MDARDFFINLISTDANCPVDVFAHKYNREDLIKFAEVYHKAKMKEELTRFMLCLTIDKYQDNKDADIIKEYMDIYFGESGRNDTKVK